MREGQRGLFITFEGIDGCGKSTQLEIFRNYLSENGIDHQMIREPGGTAIGERIRDILLDKVNTGMTPETELLLFEASRSQIVREVIRPALVEGRIVICDMFADSTTAYQGYGRRLDIGKVEALNSYAADGLEPDITFLFDLNLKEANCRLSGRDKESDRLDSESSGFTARVRNGYLEIAGKAPERVRIIDASKSVKEISESIISIFKEVSENETSICYR